VSVAEEEHALRGAMLLGFEHTLVVSPKARIAATAVLASPGGGSGIVIGLRARTLQRALGITTGQILIGKPGLPHHAAATLISHAIEIGIEIDGTAGPARVVRISELAPPPQGSQTYALRDLFVLTAGDAEKPAFTAAEAAPNISRDPPIKPHEDQVS
jgi:hypothetical protein